MKRQKKEMSTIIIFDKQINGFIGAKRETVQGQEVWIKIGPTRQAKGVKKQTMR